MSSEMQSRMKELAPSEMADEVPSFPRTVGTTGLFAVILGVLILILNAGGSKLSITIGNNVAFAAIVVGLAMMFFHAARDTDQLIRRIYGFVGGLGLPISGLILTLLPMLLSAIRDVPEGESRKIVSLFFPFGWACFLAGLFFLIPFCRNETDDRVRRKGMIGLAAFACLFIISGFAGSLLMKDFAITYGTVLSLLGLAYACVFISQSGGADGDGYKPAIAIGLIGAIVVVAAIARSLMAGDQPFFMPTGLILIAAGCLYAAVSGFMVSDIQIVVMTRRELTCYFYSPIGYMLMLITALVAGIAYINFYFGLLRDALEPIVLPYLGDFFSIITVTIIVPAITMRLISEEKRSGTYEVLMCSPVTEFSVVLSKILGGLLFFMMVWGIWSVYLIALRAEQEKVFEYRPLLSYYLAVAVSGLSFVSMGVFFSSITKNQIVAVMLTFSGMLFWIAVFFAMRMLPEGSVWKSVCSHTTYVNLWWDSLAGRLHVRDAIIQFSIAIFWGFLAVKVLEARRWS